MSSRPSRLLEENRGVSVVLGAIMVLGIAVTLWAVMYPQYIESSMNSKEMDQTKDLRKQFLDLQSKMSWLGTDDSGKVRFPMSAGSVFLYPSTSPAGTLAVDGGSPPVKVSGGNTDNITLDPGSIELTGHNRFYPTQTYILQADQVFMSQDQTDLIISRENGMVFWGDNTLYLDFARIAGEDFSVSSTGEEALSFSWAGRERVPENSESENTASLRIRIETEYRGLWRKFLSGKAGMIEEKRGAGTASAGVYENGAYLFVENLSENLNYEIFGKRVGINDGPEVITPTVDTLENGPVESTTAELRLFYDFEDYAYGDVRFKWRKASADSWIRTGWSREYGSGTYSETINGLPPSTEYFYRAEVKYNSDVRRGDIENFTTEERADENVGGGLQPPYAPKAPENLTATADGTNIQLKWDHENADDFDYYNIYRSEQNSGNFEDYAIYVDNTRSKSYRDNNLPPNSTYFYKVTAVDLDGNESLPSNLAENSTIAGELPSIAVRVDDLTDQWEDNSRFIGSYEVSNENGSFKRVDITFANQNDSSANESFQLTTVRVGVEYINSYGANDTYDIVFEVIYEDSGGGEHVAASQTVTDSADARNPDGNENLAESGSAQLTSWEIKDKSNNGQGARYKFSYQTSSGSFSEVKLGVLNLSGTNDSEVRTLEDRNPGGETRVNPDNGGYEQDHRLVIVVRDSENTVVDLVNIQDNADGDGVFTPNQAPSMGNESPDNGAVIPENSSTTLSVDVSDAEGDSMDVTFYDASDNSEIETDSGVPDGGTASVTWSGLSPGNSYNWYAVADDGTNTTRSQTWAFTVNTSPDAPSNPDPSDGEGIGNTSSTTLSVDVGDPDGDSMDVTFFDASDGSEIGTDAGVPDGGTASVTWTDLSPGGFYAWYVVADDGIDNTQSSTWTFSVGGGCPYLYGWNGDTYKLINATMPQSVLKSYETTSYQTSETLKPRDNYYDLNLFQKLPERAWINNLSLKAIDHPEDVGILTDQAGRIYTIEDPRPIKAVNEDGEDITHLLENQDDKYWTSDLEGRKFENFDGVVDRITLTLPQDVGSRAKLIIRGRQTFFAEFSLWTVYHLLLGTPNFDYLVDLFENGSSLSSDFDNAFRRFSSIKLQYWNGREWVNFGRIGIMKAFFEETVIPLNLSKIPGNRVRLLMTAGLYDIDQILVDYSKDKDVMSRTLRPVKAIRYGENGPENVLKDVEEIDNRYATISQGEYINYKFRRLDPPENVMQRTFVLPSGGYFHLTGPKVPENRMYNLPLVENLVRDPYRFEKWVLPRYVYPENYSYTEYFHMNFVEPPFDTEK